MTIRSVGQPENTWQTQDASTTQATAAQQSAATNSAASQETAPTLRQADQGTQKPTEHEAAPVLDNIFVNTNCFGQDDGNMPPGLSDTLRDIRDTIHRLPDLPIMPEIPSEKVEDLLNKLREGIQRFPTQPVDLSDLSQNTLDSMLEAMNQVKNRLNSLPAELPGMAERSRAALQDVIEKVFGQLPTTGPGSIPGETMRAPSDDGCFPPTGGPGGPQTETMRFPSDDGSMPPSGGPGPIQTETMRFPSDDGSMPPSGGPGPIQAETMLFPSDDGSMPPSGGPGPIQAETMLFPSDDGSMPPLPRNIQLD